MPNPDHQREAHVEQTERQEDKLPSHETIRHTLERVKSHDGMDIATSLMTYACHEQIMGRGTKTSASIEEQNESYGPYVEKCRRDHEPIIYEKKTSDGVFLSVRLNNGDTPEESTVVVIHTKKYSIDPKTGKMNFDRDTLATVMSEREYMDATEDMSDKRGYERSFGKWISGNSSRSSVESSYRREKGQSVEDYWKKRDQEIQMQESIVHKNFSATETAQLKETISKVEAKRNEAFFEQAKKTDEVVQRTDERVSREVEAQRVANLNVARTVVAGRVGEVTKDNPMGVLSQAQRNNLEALFAGVLEPSEVRALIDEEENRVTRNLSAKAEEAKQQAKAAENAVRETFITQMMGEMSSMKPELRRIRADRLKRQHKTPEQATMIDEALERLAAKDAEQGA